MKMEVVYSFESLVSFFDATQWWNPEDHQFNGGHCSVFIDTQSNLLCICQTEPLIFI